MNHRVFGVLSFRLSLISFLWQGRHAPSPPTPLPRSGGEGRILCFELQWKARMAPLAPGRGEGLGVRGEDPLEAAVQSHG